MIILKIDTVHEMSPTGDVSLKSPDMNPAAKEPVVVDFDAEGRQRRWYLSQGIVGAVLMLISPEMVLIFGSPKYREAVYVIPPVAASVFFIFIYNILSMPQFYYEKTQFLMAASMAAAGANVVLNFIFIRLFGYIAAGYTTLACYMLYSVGHYIVSKQILVNEGIQENLMNPGFLLACSVFLIGASIICNLIFPYRILRYAILLASAGLVFWKKELLLKTMADIRKK
jgi:O-antigen/teichoic acid export membrane protein